MTLFGIYFIRFNYTTLVRIECKENTTEQGQMVARSFGGDRAGQGPQCER